MESTSPPSYTEAINLPLRVQPSPKPERKEELKPKLCKMEKTSNSFGFHLNGIQGVHGQHIEKVIITNTAHHLIMITSTRDC